MKQQSQHKVGKQEIRVKVIIRNRKNLVAAMKSSDSSGQSSNSKD